MTTAPRTPATDHVDHEARITQLPKLELPQFSSIPLTWQHFWDYFEASIHTNNNLTSVQKLSYLRGQLQWEASRVIAGFFLTNSNYQNSITLLQEHFGQPHKQIAAHMQTLIDLHSPSGTLTSLHEFHDSIEGHIRSLASLGKSQDSYSSLLVTIILRKIPAKIIQNLARAHGRQEWKIS